MVTYFLLPEGSSPKPTIKYYKLNITNSKIMLSLRDQIIGISRKKRLNKHEYDGLTILTA